MKNKLIYVLIFFLGGIVFATGTKLYIDSKTTPVQAVSPNVMPKRKSFFERFFEDDFFADDTFSQMAEHMAKSVTGSGIIRIESSQNDQYVFIQVFLDQVDKNSLKIDIKDGQITLSGQVKLEKEEKGDFGFSKSISVSSFSRSFPAPSGVKTEEVQIENKDKSVILKFPKSPKI